MMIGEKLKLSEAVKNTVLMSRTAVKPTPTCTRTVAKPSVGEEINAVAIPWELVIAVAWLLAALIPDEPKEAAAIAPNGKERFVKKTVC
jgi:hypothetical protein